MTCVPGEAHTLNCFFVGRFAKARVLPGASLSCYMQNLPGRRTTPTSPGASPLQINPKPLNKGFCLLTEISAEKDMKERLEVKHRCARRRVGLHTT